MNWKDHLDSKYFQLGNQTAGQFFFSRLFYFIGLKKNASWYSYICFS